MNLLIGIARCPIVDHCLANPEQEHPRREIVLSQRSDSLQDHQVPKPWSGHASQAPILFLSSNPSISFSEEYPHPTWGDAAIVDFFEERFSGDYPRIKSGIYGRQKDGNYPAKGTRFWIGVRARASELLQRRAIPGEDYALSEIVHCKSTGELGVRSAAVTCADRYLADVVRMSGARIVVGLGKVAESAVKRVFALPSGSVSEPIMLGRRQRTFVFIPHPTSWTNKTFSNCLTGEAIDALRNALAETDTVDC